MPTLYWAGEEGEYSVMVTDLLGPNLEDLFNFCDRRFSVRTTLMLADQMIARLEHLHSQGFLHRDIKPENFLIGRGKMANVVYLLDYGLVKKYKDPNSQKHIPYRDNKMLTGTVRYASIATHEGIEQGRRDDLEAVSYVLMYFLRGSLPWQGVQGETKQEK